MSVSRRSLPLPSPVMCDSSEEEKETEVPAQNLDPWPQALADARAEMHHRANKFSHRSTLQSKQRKESNANVNVDTNENAKDDLVHKNDSNFLYWCVSLSFVGAVITWYSVTYEWWWFQ